MSSIDQGNTLQDVLKWEMPDNFSREKVTVLSGQSLELGEVIGKITIGTVPATGTADAGNTGSGTCTSVTGGTKTKVGIYTLTCVHAVSGGGVFTVEDPDGYALPDAIVGTAYTHDQINFTLNDGSPDFGAGDKFTITVPAGSGYVAELDGDAVNGRANAYGVLIAAVDATDGNTDGVAIVRNARIVADNLAWVDESPLSDTAWLAQLAAKGIIEADEV
jgi:hypothetical protein